MFNRILDLKPLFWKNGLPKYAKEALHRDR